MRDDLCALLADADADDAVDVVVLTAVDPVFSAGVDFKEVDGGSVPAGRLRAGTPSAVELPGRRCGR